MKSWRIGIFFRVERSAAFRIRSPSSASLVKMASSRSPAPSTARSPPAPLPQLPGWNEALLKNRAVQVITVGNKALICCKYEDLKTVSFRQHSSRYCAVPVCKNFRGKVPSLSFFQFPKDLDRCKKWIGFCNRDDLRCKDAATLYRSGHSICAEHFEDSMFMNAGSRNRLIHCAIPTVFDSSHHPPPSSIKELAARIHEKKGDHKICAEESELCLFHRKFMKTVTVLDAGIDSVHYCMRCGSAIKELKEMSTSVFRAICKKGHDALFTVEFSAKCREWATDCHNLDQTKIRTKSDNGCHLCESHFVNSPGQSTDSVKVEGSEELVPPSSSETITVCGDDLYASDSAEVTITDTCPSSSASGKSESAVYPSLPSSFFSVHGYAVHLDKVNGRSCPVPTAVSSTQTDGYYHVRARQEPSIDLKKYKLFRQQNYRMRKKIAALEERFANSPKVNAKHLSKELSKYLSGPFLRLVQEQLKAHKVSLHGMRWSDDVVTLAQVIRGESVKAYGILQRILPLPGRSVISRRPEPPGGLPSFTLFLQKMFPPLLDEDEADTLVLEGQPSEGGSCEGMDEDDEERVEEELVVEEEVADGTEEIEVDQVEEEENIDMQIQVQEVIEESVQLVATDDDLHIYEVFAQAATSIQGNDTVILQTAAVTDVLDSVQEDETT